MYGYAGKMLDVDLTSGKIKELPVGEGLARDYLGGLGFNARLLYEEIPSGADPLGPENVLVFCAGALVGTNVPTASRTEASALSPATNLFGTANSGNFWGGELKFAGFDGVIIRGRKKTTRKKARPRVICEQSKASPRPIRNCTAQPTST